MPNITTTAPRVASAPYVGTTQELDALKRRRETLLSDQSAAVAARGQMHGAGDEELQAAQRDLAGAETAPLPTEQHVDYPQMPDKPIIDAKEYESLSYALLGMALVGGAVSHGNWLAASATLNGALKGYYEGNRQQAQDLWEKYDRQFKSAQVREQQVHKQYMDALNNRNLTINEKREKVRDIATRNGHTDVYTAANLNSIDKMIGQIDARITQLTGTVQHHQDVVVRVEAAREARAASAGGAGGKNAPQTEAGRELAAQLMGMGLPVSFWGGKGRMYDQMAADGMTAQGVASNKAQLASLTSATRATALRQAGVERLTGTVTALEDEIIKTGEKYGLTGASLLNAPMNFVRKKFSDADLATLRTLIAAANRSYVEAVTMPGSNAQLHTGTQQLAEELLNSSMSVQEMLGSFKGMNIDIEAGRLAIGATAKRLNDQILSLGGLNPDLGGGGGGGGLARTPGGAGGGNDLAAAARAELARRRGGQ